MDRARALLRSGWPLLVLAFVARAVQIAATHDWVPVDDPADYVRHALSIAHGHGMAPSQVPHGGPGALRPPAYPYFLGSIFALSGDSLTAGRLASALLGVVAVALIGVIAMRLWDKRTALIAMGIAAVYPPLVLLSGTLLSESLALPICLALVALLLAYRDGYRPQWSPPAAGLLFALALLTRPALVTFAVPLIAALIVWPLRSVRGARALVIALLVAGLAIVPWTVRNAVQFDAFVPISTQPGFIIAGTYNYTSHHDPAYPGAWRPANFDPGLRAITTDDSLDENQLSKKLAKSGRTYARKHPGYVFHATWLNGLRLLELKDLRAGTKATYRSQGIGPKYATLAQIGWYLTAIATLAALALGALRRVPWWVAVMPALLYLSVIWDSGDIRYRAPVEPFVVLGAAFLVGHVWRRRSERPRV
jgi:4-amino-4-deoxy-L-arabinose transferase-like glycosyltransferase